MNARLVVTKMKRVRTSRFLAYSRVKSFTVADEIERLGRILSHCLSAIDPRWNFLIV